MGPCRITKKAPPGVCGAGGFIQVVVITAWLLAYEWRLGLVSIVGLVCALLLYSLSQKVGDSYSPRRQAARATRFDEVVDGLPQGWRTPVGSAGVGLSVGQRQRLALTRALCSTAPLVVMDEPTAHLDAASEAHVLDAVRALHASGRTVVVIAHRPALMALAEQTIAVTSQPVPPADIAPDRTPDRVPDRASAHEAATAQEEAL